MVNAADFDREFTAARPPPTQATSAHSGRDALQIASRLACMQRAYAVPHGCARVPAMCDALYTAQENLEAAAEIFEAFVLSLMANVHPPAEDAVTGSPMAKHRKKPANARG